MKRFKIIYWGTLAAALFISGCSSSSYSERYKNPKTKEDSPSKSVRFTSKDDEAEKDTNSSKDKSENNSYNNYSPEFDEKPVEENPINTKEFVEKYSKLKNFDVTLTARERLIFEVIEYLDTPYQYGGNNSDGIDCSAFTQNVFQNAESVYLPRTANEQFQFGADVPSAEKLKFGDLVFFNTTKRSYPGHVGIYMGDNKFVHASKSQGVTVSSLTENYYSSRFVGARRIEGVFNSK